MGEESKSLVVLDSAGRVRRAGSSIIARLLVIANSRDEWRVARVATDGSGS